MTEKTNLVLANKSKSLRTTIPVSVVRQFKLAVKDQMAWDLKVIDGEIRIIVTPMRSWI